MARGAPCRPGLDRLTVTAAAAVHARAPWEASGFTSGRLSMPKTLSVLAAAVVGAGLTLGAGGSSLAAGAGVIHVPSDFVPALSDTRATGHYAVQGTGLHVWTESNTPTDKVAEYVATSAPLASVGEPTLEFTNT